MAPKKLKQDWLKKLGATKQEIALGKKLVRAANGEFARGEDIEDMFPFELYDVLRVLMRERGREQLDEEELSTMTSCIPQLQDVLGFKRFCMILRERFPQVNDTLNGKVTRG